MIKFQTYQNSLMNSSNHLNNSFLTTNKNWILINQFKDEKSLKLKSKKLIIYPYSLSYNLLKEVLLKTGF